MPPAPQRSAPPYHPYGHHALLHQLPPALPASSWKQQCHRPGHSSLEQAPSTITVPGGYGQHTATNEYKDTKLHFLKIKYETFTMRVNDMYGRLNMTVNDLKGLRAKWTNLEKNIALNAGVEDKAKYSKPVEDEGNNMEEELALLARKFNEFLSRKKGKDKGSKSHRRRALMFLCESLLVVENNELKLKEEVAKLNKSLERCFKGQKAFTPYS
ncbi:hypothetical protein E2562_037982 [Oryza meyeriana var. granulata]|uniref:Uncharacterized protein n=1 Tax=Oryza meyeriana var. granulata TaxID=110450 RepID=A0A6G1EAN3_9ORYZ|nr:hypothetical protein E2562_037982 [Oryza meyeriana var. granulata]